MGVKAFCQEPEEAAGLLLIQLEALGSLPSEWHLLGHLQSALPGLPPFLHPLFATASGSLLGQCAGQGAQTLEFVCIPHLAGARAHWMQPHCSTSAESGLGSGVERKQEAKHPTPSPSPLPGRSHTPLSSQNSCWGLGHPAVSHHLFMPWCPVTQLPASSAVLRFKRGCSSPGTFS